MNAHLSKSKITFGEMKSHKLNFKAVQAVLYKHVHSDIQYWITKMYSLVAMKLNDPYV